MARIKNVINIGDLVEFNNPNMNIEILGIVLDKKNNRYELSQQDISHINIRWLSKSKLFQEKISWLEEQNVFIRKIS